MLLRLVWVHDVILLFALLGDGRRVRLIRNEWWRHWVFPLSECFLFLLQKKSTLLLLSDKRMSFCVKTWLTHWNVFCPVRIHAEIHSHCMQITVHTAALLILWDTQPPLTSVPLPSCFFIYLFILPSRNCPHDSVYWFDVKRLQVVFVLHVCVC